MEIKNKTIYTFATTFLVLVPFLDLGGADIEVCSVHESSICKQELRGLQLRPRPATNTDVVTCLILVIFENNHRITISYQFLQLNS